MWDYKSLVCVKSLMTIVLIVALVVLAFRCPSEYAETLKSSVTMVVTFYFAHQNDKSIKRSVDNG